VSTNVHHKNGQNKLSLVGLILNNVIILFRPASWPQCYGI